MRGFDDLKGRTVALTARGGTDELALRMVLNQHGRPADFLVPVFVGAANNVLAALVSGGQQNGIINRTQKGELARAGGLNLGRRAAVQLLGEKVTLALGQRADRLDLAHAVALEELAAPRAAPASLRHEQLSDRPPAGRVGAFEDHVGGGDLAVGDASLELGASQANRVGLSKCS